MPRRNRNRKNKNKKAESGPKEVVNVTVNAPPEKAKPMKTKSHTTRTALSSLGLKPSSVRAASHLLQPDAYVAKSMSNSGIRYPGSGEPTATCTLRSFTTLEMNAQSEALVVMYPQAQCLHYRYADSTEDQLLEKGLGYILTRFVQGGGTLDSGAPWPAPVKYNAGVFSNYLSIVTDQVPAAGTIRYEILPLSITDGGQLWDMITACSKTGVDGDGRRMRYRPTAGDIFGQVTATLDTQLLVHCAQTQTGSSSVLHTDFTNAQLRANALNYDYRVINVNSDGFNARYIGPIAPNTPYDAYHPNQVGMDADEDSGPAAAVKELLKCFSKAGTLDMTKLAKISERLGGSAEMNSVNVTDSPPDVADTLPIVLLQNAATITQEVVLTAGMDLEFVPQLDSGFEVLSVEPDPNWAKVLTVSHTSVPFLVGPHSFASFFSSLWGGIKSAASGVWDTAKSIAGQAANNAAQAATSTAAQGAIARLAPMV